MDHLFLMNKYHSHHLLEKRSPGITHYPICYLPPYASFIALANWEFILFFQCLLRLYQRIIVPCQRDYFRHGFFCLVFAILWQFNELVLFSLIILLLSDFLTWTMDFTFVPSIVPDSFQSSALAKLGSIAKEKGGRNVLRYHRISCSERCAIVLSSSRSVLRSDYYDIITVNMKFLTNNMRSRLYKLIIEF
ncbi:hypothetical protein ACS0TY_009030 [Phlomoides rotata]